MTRYLVAPDKFKGTLTAKDAASTIARGIRRADPTAVIVEFPFADGGEGTVQAVLAAGGTEHLSTVTGPLGEPVEVMWAEFERVAFIEMAEASGLRHVVPSPRTALRADTSGVGELIRHALDLGSVEIMIGVGGSATTDGGFGALRSIGCRFLDARGAEIVDVTGLRDVRDLDVSGLDERLQGVEIELCADVLSPMLGIDGAARVFGPQKGADASVVEELEARLRSLAAVYARHSGPTPVERGGAAGGLAAGVMAVLGGHVRGGVEVLAELLHLDERIAAADVVVVGEGSLDEQSRLGKTPVGIARRARAIGVPVVAIVGTTTLAADALQQDGIVDIVSASSIAGSSEAALARAAHFVELAAATAVGRRAMRRRDT